MNRLIVFLLLVGLASSCTEDPGRFTVTGTVADAGGRTIYLTEMTTQEFVPVDSARLDEDGNFTLLGTTGIMRFYALQFRDTEAIVLLLEGGNNVKVEAGYEDFHKSYKISGSEDSEKVRQLNMQLNNTMEQIYELNRILNDSSEHPEFPRIKADLDRRYQEIIDAQRAFTTNFIRLNLRSLASLMALYQQVSPRHYLLDPVEDFEYFAMVDSSLQLFYNDSEAVKELHRQVTEVKSQLDYMLESQKHVSKGAVAPEIALPDPAGDTVLLSSLRGKIVLLDFWASWCAPCRQENPNLVSVYEQYAHRGFEIYQVSLDRSREAWLRGIREDKLNWTHVSDLRMWESVVVNIYGLQGIPMNFLLDEEGRIIDKNLRGPMLKRKLAEVFADK